MSVVRPEFGPTLPELVGPRIRALPRAAQVALAGLAALVVVALALLLVRDARDQRTTVVVREPTAYNLVYPPALERVRPRGRETLRLQTPPGTQAPQSFAVTPFRLPAYHGDATGVMTLMSANLIRRMRATIPGFVWRSDGRVNYNRQPGYEILFQAKLGGRTTYGRRTLLVPGGDVTLTPREGLDIMMMAARSPAIPRVDAIGARPGALETAIRSLRFGTERP
jgi:hypothetical protein